MDFIKQQINFLPLPSFLSTVKLGHSSSAAELSKEFKTPKQKQLKESNVPCIQSTRKTSFQIKSKNSKI